MPSPENGGRIVLVIEDNPIAREGLGVVLRHAGYTPVLAADGQGALAVLRHGPPPALILLDMMLPDRDGWAILEELRREPTLAAIPVVIVTGLGIASPEWARALGASGLVQKPVDVTTLLTEVRRHVADQ